MHTPARDKGFCGRERPFPYDTAAHHVAGNVPFPYDTVARHVAGNAPLWCRILTSYQETCARKAINK